MLRKILLRLRYLKFRLLRIQLGKSVRLYGTGIFVQGKNIRIGHRCTINNYVALNSKYEALIIGDDVTISDGVYITTQGLDLDLFRQRQKDHREKPVVIGNHVWIGAKAIILPGVTIGDDVVIGAGAVVSRDIPRGSIALGVPARVVGKSMG